MHCGSFASGCKGSCMGVAFPMCWCDCDECSTAKADAKTLQEEREARAEDAWDDRPGRGA